MVPTERVNDPILITSGDISFEEVGQYPVSAIESSLEEVGKLGTPKQVTRAMSRFLHGMAKAAFSKENPAVNLEPFQPWLTLYDEAKRIIKELMCMDFGFVQRGIDVVPALNGRPIQVEQLSEGQRILLTATGFLLNAVLAQFRTSEYVSLQGAIVEVDEPELHLHPAAVIHLVRSLRKLVGEEGQLWIATHAVYLLPYLAVEEIWTVQDGAVLSPGIERFHEAVRLLVGSNEDVEKLHSLLQKPYEWAAAKFAAESLLPPF
jgi:hypothetical protein